MKKKIPIKYAKERVLLSDILPYETPLTFSNRYFYNHLIKKRKLKDKIKKLETDILNEVDTDKKNALQINCDELLGHLNIYNEIEKIFTGRIRAKNTIPFVFNIRHKSSDFRELSIIHPINQLEVVDFYTKYSPLILYYSTVSEFSIRKPFSVSKYHFYNDLLHKKNKNGDLEHSIIEEDDSEYETLKSYFTYRKYSNIHRFYENYQFHRSEKKYNKLLKVDISKCFDSVYTHTISWAIFNKLIVKDSINLSRKTFAGEFDDLMQALNKNETNGIVIGPEFSRIFAELILQQIDKDILENLKNEHNLIHKIDYEVFRYVDDYFVFYNSDSDMEQITKALKLALKEYKMYINDSKSIAYSKPIITEISIAKQKVSDLFNQHFNLKVNNSKKGELKNIINDLEKFHKKIAPQEQTNYENIPPIIEYLKAFTSNDKDFQDDWKLEQNKVYFTSSNIITRFKSIIKETGIEYKDIMNYTLAIIDKKTASIIKKYHTEKEKNELQSISVYEKAFLEILDVTFFFYSVTPRVNFTVKLSLILEKIITFLNKNKKNNYTSPFSTSSKHNIFKKISDEIFLILKKNSTIKEVPIETLYLLIALSELGREYRLSVKNICSYFNLEIDDKEIVHAKHELNYFSITVLLFYIKDIEMYEPIKDAVRQIILNKFKNSKYKGKWNRETELVLLLLDSLACPYLNYTFSTKKKDNIRQKLGNLLTLLESPFFDIEKHLKDVKLQLELLNKFKGIKKTIEKIDTAINTYSSELQKDDPKKEIAFKKLHEKIRGIQQYLENGYLEKYEFKRELLELAGFSGNNNNIIEQEEYWFTKWTNFDFGLELQAKRGQDVY